MLPVLTLYVVRASAIRRNVATMTNLTERVFRKKKVAGLKCDLDLSQTNQVPLM